MDGSYQFVRTTTEAQRHRERTEVFLNPSQPRRHKDTKDAHSKRRSLGFQREAETHGRTTGDSGSPVAGEKPACSEREHSSQTVFSPADALGARRFCLSSQSTSGTAHPSHRLNRDEKWRGLRSPRAQATGPKHRNERSHSSRCSGPAVPGRHETAGTSPPW